KRLQGISDLKDLTDRNQGLRLVIELKNGFNPEAVLEELYRLTPMEESFGINNVTLVDGQPQTLGLRELLEIYVNHRLDVVRRRSEYRRTKRRERLHLVDGLLVALLDIDRVIALIREADDTAAARDALMSSYDLSEVQARYILDTPLRRLTRFDHMELETERDKLNKEIDELSAILESDKKLRRLVSKELGAVAKQFARPRRTQPQERDGLARTTTLPLEMADHPCHVLLGVCGTIGRSKGATPPHVYDGIRTAHDAISASIPTSSRSDIGLVTDLGRMIRIPVVELPELPDEADHKPPLASGLDVSEFVELDEGEQVVSVVAMTADGPGFVLGTRGGIVKRVAPDYPPNRDDFEVITLKDDDRVVGAGQLLTGEEDLAFITSEAQLLRFSASTMRSQGRPAGGVAGIRLSEDARVLWFGVVTGPDDSVVVTVSGASHILDGTQTGAAKVTPFSAYPTKGRATGGVRCHRYLKGEDTLLFGWIGRAPARASRADGKPVRLPDVNTRRDGSGEALPRAITTVGSGQTDFGDTPGET